MKTLESLTFELLDAAPTTKARAIIETGDALAVHRMATAGDTPGFVATDGMAAWRALSSVRETIDGDATFCEWGSGLGLVTCLAEVQGMQATGLDAEERLVMDARKFATQHGLSAQFHIASYKPVGWESKILPAAALQTGHGFSLFDFDVIYAYTWPAEVRAATRFIARHARSGTFFLRYRGGLDFKLFRVGG